VVYTGRSVTHTDLRVIEGLVAVVYGPLERA